MLNSEKKFLGFFLKKNDKKFGCLKISIIFVEKLKGGI